MQISVLAYQALYQMRRPSSPLIPSPYSFILIHIQGHKVSPVSIENKGDILVVAKY